MATLTPEQKKIYEQLAGISETLKKINTAYKPAPSSPVAGASASQPLNAAQMGGASGVGFEDEETQEEISSQVEATTKSGGSKSQAGDSISSSQASSLVKSSGLDGLFDSKLILGKSFGEAARIVQQEKAKRTGQISANTSFAFNPETLSKTQRAIDKFGFALNDVSNDPFEPKEFKDEQKNNVIEVTSKEIGSLFESPEALYNAYETNKQFKDSFDKFIQKGGSLEGVSKNIATPVTGTPLEQAQADLGGENNQTPDQFLASLSNPNANPEAEKMALEELAPESAIAQKEIMRQAGISEDLQTLYFGDEKTMGVLQMKQAQAEERKRLIEEQEKDAKRTVRDRAELTIEKGRADADQTKAKIEENRLAAKNYMTAQLAKLGALNTTGAAPLALQTLETKYQNQVTQIDTAYKFAEREIEIGLEEDLDEIENSADEMILSIEEDITKDRETSVKEILKARQAAEKEIYRITEQYGRRLRERTSKYTTDLQKEAEKFAKEFAKKAGNGLSSGSDLFSLRNNEEGTLSRASTKDSFSTSTKDVKSQIKKNLPSTVSSKVISELTDEQMVIFLEDYLNERVGKQQSFDPNQYFTEWKKAVGVGKKSTALSDDPLSQLESKLGL